MKNNRDKSMDKNIPLKRNYILFLFIEEIHMRQVDSIVVIVSSSKGASIYFDIKVK